MHSKTPHENAVFLRKCEEIKKIQLKKFENQKSDSVFSK